MALSSTVTMDWGDGTYSFTLRLREIEELQRLTGVGFGALVNRVLSGDFHIRDVLETIRLGLIGGGTDPTRAKELVATYAEGRPLFTVDDPSSPLTVAQSVILAAYSGIPEGDDDEGKPKAGTTGGSTSRQSARQPSKTRSARAKST